MVWCFSDNRLLYFNTGKSLKPFNLVSLLHRNEHETFHKAGHKLLVTGAKSNHGKNFSNGNIFLYR